MPSSDSIPLGLCACGCGQRTAIAPKSTRSRGYVKGQPYRYVSGHNQRCARPDFREEDRGYATPCWIWLKSRSTTGYGKTTRNGVTRPAHRVYYEERVGPIPDGFFVDHLCEVRACVNPSHLEPVTQTENTRRARVTKLTAQAVEEMKGLAALGWSSSDIAPLYGVDRSTVSYALRGATWRDIEA